MAQDVIKLNYPAMREMAAHCRKVSQRLQETVKMGQTIAQQMQNGALVGDAGEAFSGALQQAFVPSVNRLALKFNEVAADIQKAIDVMQDEDSEAGGRFVGGRR